MPLEIVVPAWLFVTLLGSAACAAAVLLPYFNAGRVEARWRRLVLFGVVLFAFWYLLLLRVFRFEGI